MQPWFAAYFLDIGKSRYSQLTPVKTRYLLTSITGSGLEFIEITCFLIDLCPGTGFIGSQVQARLIYCHNELRF